MYEHKLIQIFNFKSLFLPSFQIFGVDTPVLNFYFDLFFSADLMFLYLFQLHTKHIFLDLH